MRAIRYALMGPLMVTATLLSALISDAHAVTYTLRADVSTVTMPDGNVVPICSGAIGPFTVMTDAVAGTSEVQPGSAPAITSRPIQAVSTYSGFMERLLSFEESYKEPP